MYPNAGFTGGNISCDTCHGNIPAINPNFGTHFRNGKQAAGFGTAAINETQMRTVIQRMELANVDSDGDGFLNVDEFRNNTNPNNSASIPGSGTTTTTTTTRRPPTTMSGGGSGGEGSLSNRTSQPEGNYLNSGCAVTRRSELSDQELFVQATHAGILLLLPLGFLFYLRRKK